MKSMDLNHLCLGCMGYLDSPDEPCPDCGWVKNTQNAIHQLMAGSRLSSEDNTAEYVIGRVIGEGGFGITYIAWDIRKQQKVAIKEFYPSDIAGRQRNSHTIRPFSTKENENYNHGLRRFMEEGEKLRTFNHDPRIVSVKNYFKANGTAYIVMEYIEGDTLQDRIKSGVRFSIDEAIMILAPIAGALVQMHNTTIHDENNRESVLIHRDVSPDNIIFTSSNATKLLDLGASRAASYHGTKNFTTTVKLGYAPPEQFIGSGTAGAQGPWTDVYALAATVYQSITGVMPPPALDRQVSDMLKPPSVYGVKLTEYQEAVLIKGLSLDWQERYQTVDGFYNALQNIRPPVIGDKKTVGSVIMLGLGLLLNMFIFLAIIAYIINEDDDEFTSEFLSAVFSDPTVWLLLGLTICMLAYIWDLLRLLRHTNPPKWLFSSERRSQVMFIHIVCWICIVLVTCIQAENVIMLTVIFWIVYGVVTICGINIGRKVLNLVWQ